jgi:hypothetical protein
MKTAAREIKYNTPIPTKLYAKVHDSFPPILMKTMVRRIDQSISHKQFTFHKFSFGAATESKHNT